MPKYKSLIYNNLSWLFLDKFIHLLIGLIVTVWVARYLGPQNYGILNYAIAYTSFFSIFVKLGLDKIIVREVVRSPEKLNVYLGTGFILKLVGGILSTILILISFLLIDLDATVKWTIFLISFGFIFQSFDIIDFYYQAYTLSKYVVIARNISFILCNLIKIYFIMSGFNVLFFAFIASFEIFLSSVFLVVVFKLLGNNLFLWRFDKQIIGTMLMDSWPLAVNMFLVSIHVRIDQAMVKSFLDLGQLGIFSVAVKIAEYWYFIPAILVQTLMPYFVELRQVNYVLYEQRLMQLYSIMFWAGSAVGVFIIVFGDQLILLLFGKEYISAYQALVYSIWKGIFVSQALARGIWIINENVQFYRLLVNGLAVVTNILLNIILIPKMGISGAGLSSLISIGISTWVYSYFITPLKQSTVAMIKSISPVFLLRRKLESIS